MPELPEAETMAADLDEAVGGRRIEEVSVSCAKIVASEAGRFAWLLTGAEIIRVKRLGKWIHFVLKSENGAAALLVHLKMTGQFHLGAWPEGQGGRGWLPHDRAAFRLSGLPPESEALFYRDIRKFGRLRAFDAAELDLFLAELALGPDALAVSEDEFHERLKAKKGRLKSVLLDQRVVAGLGNIYADESLFAAALSPLAPARALTRAQSDLLLREIRRILSASIRARGSTTSNYQGLKGGGSFQKSHKVYGRAGEPCPVCRGVVKRIVVGGRGAHYCPSCQRAPGLSGGSGS
ncbi:MAG: bifunctional DNA-formamidopyrimidine glycosylase/DNA-(apurinic or apyrimidinic site) lyase [Candidatus Adiutrix sp.]|jgi:formamidopyrimidine-DNA glycosylase|nr:bifunctional DNA-formamidopyrimidine glycosylase/DNA-(apurinic or apyrimidinic site) lyase [Candidatus Adiutrix sp.]